MDIEKVRNFFELVRKTREERESLAEERAEVMKDMSEAKGLDYESPRVMSSSVVDLSQKLERIYAKCDELDVKLAEVLDKLAQLRKEAHLLIALCPNAMQRMLLYDYYLQGKSWDEIRKKRHYGRSQPFEIRKQAFYEISKRADSIGLRKVLK